MPETTVEITRRVVDALNTLGTPLHKRVIVALSGGVDSQVLAHALMRAAGETGHSLHAVHVNHGLRSAADADAESVASLCRRWGLPFDIVEVEVDQWDAILHQGTEAAARAARYAGLAGVADTLGTDVIATGHTLDDQAETVLMRLIAGTGLEGLSGISHISHRTVRADPAGERTVRVSLFRPLLNVTRNEIEQYARECGLTPIEDPSNQDVGFRRNAIRLRVLPELEQIEPAFRQAIFRTAALLREDAAFVNDSVDTLFAEAVAERASVWMIERQQFREIHPAQQRRILYRVIEPLLSPSARVGLERIDALREAAVGGRPGMMIELADDLVAYVDYDRLAVGRANTLESDLRGLSWLPLIDPGAEFPVSGEVDIALDNGWRIRGEADAESGLLLRTRRDGDRVGGTRDRTVKLQDWLVDRKVPRYVRDWLPVVASGDEIKWIIGLDMTEYTDSRKHINLRLERDAGTSAANR